MIQAKCVQKFRDKNNNIKGYLLEDCNGQQLQVSSEQLKMAIFSKQIEIINLTLTKDGKLVDKGNKAKDTLDFKYILEYIGKLKRFKHYFTDMTSSEEQALQKLIDLFNTYYELETEQEKLKIVYIYPGEIERNGHRTGEIVYCATGGLVISIMDNPYKNTGIKVNIMGIPHSDISDWSYQAKPQYNEELKQIYELSKQKVTISKESKSLFDCIDCLEDIVFKYCKVNSINYIANAHRFNRRYSANPISELEDKLNYKYDYISDNYILIRYYLLEKDWQYSRTVPWHRVVLEIEASLEKLTEKNIYKFTVKTPCDDLSIDGFEFRLSDNHYEEEFSIGIDSSEDCMKNIRQYILKELDRLNKSYQESLL